MTEESMEAVLRRVQQIVRDEVPPEDRGGDGSVTITVGDNNNGSIVVGGQTIINLPPASGQPKSIDNFSDDELSRALKNCYREWWSSWLIPIKHYSVAGPIAALGLAWAIITNRVMPDPGLWPLLLALFALIGICTLDISKNCRTAAFIRTQCDHNANEIRAEQWRREREAMGRYAR
nr:hypothetical protein 10 [Saccharospirillaceae bacterium]